MGSGAERELGWSRVTIRKGQRELTSGVTCLDAFAARAQARRGPLTEPAGRSRGDRDGPEPDRSFLSDHPPLYAADGRRGASPAHRAEGLHRRGSALHPDHRGQAQHARLLSPDGGEDATPKKIAATDAIFAQVLAVNQAADAAQGVLRVSMDAKATVKIGPFSRNGRSRVPVAAADHDFQPEGTVTPVGLLLPELDELFLYGVTSRVTSDCLVDRLVQWWEAVRARFAHITTLVLNLDNGPENVQPPHPVRRPTGAVRGRLWPDRPPRLLPALSQQVQPRRALLGHPGAATGTAPCSTRSTRSCASPPR